MDLSSTSLERLDSPEVLQRHLEALFAIDQRLADVARRAGSFAIRRQPGGFAGLAKVICGQQLSVASAHAIWSRFEQLEGALDPERYLTLTEEAVRGVGFSLGKFRTVGVIAEAVVNGVLDFERLDRLPTEAAIAELTALKGVGPWTAEIYLMFCAGHPDVFPAGDLALQKGVHWALGLDVQPTSKQLVGIAEAWSPYRHAAALLFWRYYAMIKNKEGVPL